MVITVCKKGHNSKQHIRGIIPHNRLNMKEKRDNRKLLLLLLVGDIGLKFRSEQPHEDGVLFITP